MRIPDKLAGRILREFTGRIPREIFGRIPKQASGRIPGKINLKFCGTPGRISERRPVKIPGKNSGKISAGLRRDVPV